MACRDTIFEPAEPDDQDADYPINVLPLTATTENVLDQEPLPKAHPFWQDARLRITPHIASDSLPEVVAMQVIETARALRDDQPLAMGIDRRQGY